MNASERKIFDIIKGEVCGKCLQLYLDAGQTEEDQKKFCPLHMQRCYAGFERQAKEIHRLVVAPLEEKCKQ